MDVSAQLHSPSIVDSGEEMSHRQVTDSMLPAIEAELQRQVARLNEPATLPFYEMLTYHMGWTGEGAGPEATGKRVRPLLLLLCAAACGGDHSSSTAWQSAL